MIDFIKGLFGLGHKIDFAELMSKGAVIIDVRTKGEYQNGHIKGSINIPLDALNNNLSKFKKDKIIIICCASGMRSSSAKSILKSSDFEKVYNGGGWVSLKNKIGNKV